MASLININSTHLVSNGFNNRFEYQFSNTSLNLSNAEIAVSSIQMYNSHFNIDAQAYNNASFRLLFLNSAPSDLQTFIDITLPDGYWEYSDINRYVQGIMKANGAYLIDDNGNDIFYFKISANSTFYACQIDTKPIPTALPTGWSLPPTGIYSQNLPSFAHSPTLRLLSNNNFNQIIGFRLLYPDNETIIPTVNQDGTGGVPLVAAARLSTIPPQINPVSSYLVRCNLISNPFSQPSDILTTFTTQGTQAGQLINYLPPELIWIDVSDGSYQSLNIEINDQLARFIRFRDPNIQINLVIRQKKS